MTLLTGITLFSFFICLLVILFIGFKLLFLFGERQRLNEQLKVIEAQMEATDAKLKHQQTLLENKLQELDNEAYDPSSKTSEKPDSPPEA